MAESISQDKISTPNGICVADLFNKSFFFEVPIYQRVFTWGEEQFERLFKDLEKHFCSTTGVDDFNERYYLGIITVVCSENDDNKYVLVDGQQRLTCILLLGALLGWKLEYRKLTYAARHADEEALRVVYEICFPKSYPKRFQDIDYGSKIKDQIAKIGNKAMAGFLNYALTNKNGYELLQKLNSQGEIIKSKLTLLISCLPDDPYRTNMFEQNRYFEKMNYGGKQLEPHEILKVRICKGLDETYLKSWNAISYFGKFYKESEEDSSSSVKSSHDKLPSLSAYLKDDAPQKDDIRYAIYEQCKKQLSQYESDSENSEDLRRGVISFPMFLLHVLYLCQKADGQKDTKVVEEDYLLKSFSDVENWSKAQKMKFIDRMKEYRKFLDSEIIHIKTMENCESHYFFYESDSTPQKDEMRDSVPVVQHDIMEFQSMLYVSSGKDQSWLLSAYYKKFQRNGKGALELLKSIMRDPLLDSLLDSGTMKVIHQAQNQWPDDCLKYGTENRRWLALLDYLLWEEYSRFEKGVNADSIFTGLFDAQKFKEYEAYIRSSIRNYVFRKSRSVEHLHSQTDSESTNQEDWEAHKDIFGNLALISPGSNSEYGNQPVGGKTDRVIKLLLDGGTHGSKIESIKLLLMLAKCNGEDVKWTVEKARQHADDMLKLFKVFLGTDSTQSATNIKAECCPIDLSDNMEALGVFIEKRFFDGITTGRYSVTVVRKDEENWDSHDEEKPNKWCGRYFKIGCGSKNFEAFIGWFFGHSRFRNAPCFIIQIDKNAVSEISALNTHEWYDGGGGWMNKDIAGSPRDVESVALEFKREIESLCMG